MLEHKCDQCLFIGNTRLTWNSIENTELHATPASIFARKVWAKALKVLRLVAMMRCSKEDSKGAASVLTSSMDQSGGGKQPANGTWWPSIRFNYQSGIWHHEQPSQGVWCHSAKQYERKPSSTSTAVSSVCHCTTWRQCCSVAHLMLAVLQSYSAE